MMKRSRHSQDEDDTAGYGEDVAIIPVSKIVNLGAEKSDLKTNTTIQCSLPGHAKGKSFANYHEYETHYVQVHTNRCLECGRNFPTSHIMGLHIQEHHDALAEMKREQGEATYACLVEACGDKFESHKQRKMHLIKDHTYPQNYFFAVTKFGIDRRQSMLVERRHGKNNQRIESYSEERGSGDHNAKPAGHRHDTGESKDVPMTDAERPAKQEQEAAQDIPMIETGQPAEIRPVRGLAPGEARKLLVAEPSDVHMKQDSAAVDAEMEGLIGAMSSLKFVPRAVQLGLKQKARP